MNGIKDNLLTIIIPTYNRESFLDYSLSKLSEYNKIYSFSLIVCDNASTDGTSEVIERWKTSFSEFKYIRQSNNVGYAKNVTVGYLVVETDYCWVLGDSYLFSEQALSIILKTLSGRHPDAIILNNEINVLDFMPDRYCKVDDILATIGWYLTLLCSCIVSRDFISEEVIRRYVDTRFLHLGVFIDHLCFLESFEVICLKEAQVDPIKLGINKSPKNRASWQHTPFKVFAEGWFQFVMSLPNTIPLPIKLKCIKDHDKKSHIFYPLRIFALRMERYLSYTDYWECRKYMYWVTEYSIWLYDLIYFCPPMPKIICYLKKQSIIEKLKSVIS